MWVAWLWKLLRNKRFRAWLLATAGPRAIALFLVWIERVRHRQVAIGEARQIDGMFSAAIIDGERHVVVWKDGEPISSVPAGRGRPGSEAESARAQRPDAPGRPADQQSPQMGRGRGETTARRRAAGRREARAGAHHAGESAREGKNHLGEGAHAIRQLLPGGRGDDAAGRGA